MNEILTTWIPIIDTMFLPQYNEVGARSYKYTGRSNAPFLFVCRHLSLPSHSFCIFYPLPYLILLLLCPLQNLSCLVPYPFPYLTVLFLSPTLSLILLSSPLFPTLSFNYLFFSCPFLFPLPQSSLNHFPIYSFFCSSLSLTVTHTKLFS